MTRVCSCAKVCVCTRGCVKYMCVWVYQGVVRSEVKEEVNFFCEISARFLFNCYSFYWCYLLLLLLYEKGNKVDRQLLWYR